VEAARCRVVVLRVEGLIAATASALGRRHAGSSGCVTAIELARDGGGISPAARRERSEPRTSPDGHKTGQVGHVSVPEQAAFHSAPPRARGRATRGPSLILISPPSSLRSSPPPHDLARSWRPARPHREPCRPRLPPRPVPPAAVARPPTAPTRAHGPRATSASRTRARQSRTATSPTRWPPAPTTRAAPAATRPATARPSRPSRRPAEAPISRPLSAPPRPPRATHSSSSSSSTTPPRRRPRARGPRGGAARRAGAAGRRL